MLGSDTAGFSHSKAASAQPATRLATSRLAAHSHMLRQAFPPRHALRASVTRSGPASASRCALAALVLFACTAAAAGDLTCYEEPGTRKTSCVDERAVRANGDTRAAALYSGGPNSLRPSGTNLVADCKLGVLALEDRKGVIFGAGPRDATKMSRALYDVVCQAQNPKRDPKLRAIGK